MLELFGIHDLAEAWLLESSQSPLNATKRWLLQRHLRSCARCRSLALDLVEFTHEVPGETLSPEESIEIKAATMAGLRNEIMLARMNGSYRRRVEPPLPFFRPSIGLALAAAAILLALIVILSLPKRGERDSASASAKAPVTLNADAQPEPEPEPAR